MTARTIAEVAADLIEAAASGVPIAPVAPRFAPGDLDSAYAVQKHVTAKALARGRRVVGRKIGLTSLASTRPTSRLPT